LPAREDLFFYRGVVFVFAPLLFDEVDDAADPRRDLRTGGYMYRQALRQRSDATRSAIRSAAVAAHCRW